MKTWKPDTCECVIEEIYEGTQIVGGGQVVKKCQAHQEVSDEDLYGVLYANPDGENKVKNQMYRIFLGEDQIKGLDVSETKLNRDGSSAGLGLKEGIDFKWSFEGTGYNRKLKVNLEGIELAEEQKTEIKALSDEKFGENKVEIL